MNATHLGLWGCLIYLSGRSDSSMEIHGGGLPEEIYDGLISIPWRRVIAYAHHRPVGRNMCRGHDAMGQGGIPTKNPKRMVKKTPCKNRG